MVTIEPLTSDVIKMHLSNMARLRRRREAVAKAHALRGALYRWSGVKLMRAAFVALMALIHGH